MSKCVRPATRDDLPAVARIHKSRFRGTRVSAGPVLPVPDSCLLRPVLGAIHFPGAHQRRQRRWFHSGRRVRDSQRLQTRVRASQRFAVCRGNGVPSVAMARRIAHHARLRAAAKQDARSQTRRLPPAPPFARHRRGGQAERARPRQLFETLDAQVRDAYPAYELTVYKSNTRLVKYYEILGFQRVGETAQAFIYRKNFRPLMQEPTP